MNVWKLVLEIRKSYPPIAIDLCIKLVSLGWFPSKWAECPPCFRTWGLSNSQGAHVVSLKSAFDSDSPLASFWLRTMLKCFRGPYSFFLVLRCPLLDCKVWALHGMYQNSVCGADIATFSISTVPIQGSVISVIGVFHLNKEQNTVKLDTLGTLSDGGDRITRDLWASCQRFRAFEDIQNDYILTLYLESKGVLYAFKIEGPRCIYNVDKHSLS